MKDMFKLSLIKLYNQNLGNVMSYLKYKDIYVLPVGLCPVVSDLLRRNFNILPLHVMFYLKNNPQSVSEYATPQTCAYLPFHETHHPPPHQLPLSKHWGWVSNEVPCLYLDT